MDYTYDFSQKQNQPLSMSYVSPKFSVVLSSSAAKTYSFKNVRLEFKEALTSDGVSFYRNIDNDNNDSIFSFINPRIGVRKNQDKTILFR